MQTFPSEVFGVLGSKLELSDILALASTNTDFRKTFLDPEVNVQLAEHFGFPYNLSLFELEEYESLTPKNKLFRAAEFGDMRIFEFQINRLSNMKFPYENDMNDIYITAINPAASGGQMKLVKLLLEKVTWKSEKDKLESYNNAMRFAAQGGYKEIVDFFIALGADDYNNAMNGASLGGHMDIVRFMLDKGATNYNEAMSFAAQGGHMDIVRFMLDKGATVYSLAMESASFGGHIEIVKFMLDLLKREGRETLDNYNESMVAASRGGHVDIIKFMLSLGANDYDNSMKDAAEGGHIEIVKWMKELGATNYNSALFGAMWNNHFEIVKLLIEYGASLDKASGYFGLTNKRITKFIQDKMREAKDKESMK